MSRDDSNTYTMQDRFNREELERLLIHDQMFTDALGVLPEQSDPTRFQSVLDIGCGPGGWLREAAKAYPNLSRLVGVDINEKMINYAQAQTKALQLDDRVAFHTMDGLRPLDFPDAHFEPLQRAFWYQLAPHLGMAHILAGVSAHHPTRRSDPGNGIPDSR